MFINKFSFYCQFFNSVKSFIVSNPSLFISLTCSIATVRPMWVLLSSILYSLQGPAPSILGQGQGIIHPHIVSDLYSTHMHGALLPPIYSHNLLPFCPSKNMMHFPLTCSLFFLFPCLFRSPQVPPTCLTLCSCPGSHSWPPILPWTDCVPSLTPHHSAYTTATSTSQAWEENSEYLSSSFVFSAPSRFLC